MSREIKFRGKRIDNGEWIYGGYANKDDKVYIIIKIRYTPDTRDWDTVEYYENHPNYTLSFAEVLPDTVGQYIGVTDKNGKEIYEGDIVKRKMFDDFEIGQVVWINDEYCGFRLKCKGYYLPIPANKKTGKSEIDEVIGNAHENSDLFSEVENEQVYFGDWFAGML